MAEAFLNKYGNDLFEAESAGIEPGKMNPNVIKVMLESGIDLSAKKTQAVNDLYSQGKNYDAVITVCDAASAEKCPVFPGKVKRLAWSFPDPSSYKGTNEQVLQFTRKVRDEIKSSILDFVREAGNEHYWNLKKTINQ